jgi:SAM-dependent methyltransferase
MGAGMAIKSNDAAAAAPALEPYRYAGEELEVVVSAHNWKGYWSSAVREHLRGDVLEVGAGIGANTRLLRGLTRGCWTCLEPDRRLLERMTHWVPPEVLASVNRRQGTLAALGPERFDTILYIDVLEHIEDDAGEMARAGAHLRPGGNLIVLCPAYPFLFSRLDETLGHFRRYTRAALERCRPPGCRTVRAFYLDSLGTLLSVVNRFILRQSHPGPLTVRFWDGMVVPVSRRLDPLLGYRVGRSVVLVWRKD